MGAVKSLSEDYQRDTFVTEIQFHRPPYSKTRGGVEEIPTYAQVATLGQKDFVRVEILLIVLSDGPSNTCTTVSHLDIHTESDT